MTRLSQQILIHHLFFLLQDVGVEAFVEAIKKEAKIDFAPAGQTLVQSQNIALGANRVLQRNGKYAYKLIVPSGIFSGTDMIELAKSSIENETMKAMTELKNQIADLSVEIAEKVLRSELSNRESQMTLVEKLVQEAEDNFSNKQ